MCSGREKLSWHSSGQPPRHYQPPVHPPSLVGFDEDAGYQHLAGRRHTVDRLADRRQWVCGTAYVESPRRVYEHRMGWRRCVSRCLLTRRRPETQPRVGQGNRPAGSARRRGLRHHHRGARPVTGQLKIVDRPGSWPPRSDQTPGCLGHCIARSTAFDRPPPRRPATAGLTAGCAVGLHRLAAGHKGTPEPAPQRHHH